jgi:hypothetical protein
MRSIEDAVIAHGTKVTVGTGTVSGLLGAFTLHETLAIAGFFVALGSLVVQGVFLWLRHHRESKEHKLRMKILERQAENQLSGAPHPIAASAREE